MLKKININSEIQKNTRTLKFENVKLNLPKLNLAYMVLKDMMYFTQVWRQVRGYSSNGQRSHSNNKNNKKQKLLNGFRQQQFYQLFGRKKRDIFPTLILAEYNNRLWYLNWHQEWFQAYAFIINLAHKNKLKVKFDPQLLSKNVITGVKKIKKKKHNTVKKKIVLVATIGLPVPFSLYLYNFQNQYKLPFELVIPDDSRRKMGKKKKKK